MLNLSKTLNINLQYDFMLQNSTYAECQCSDLDRNCPLKQPSSSCPTGTFGFEAWPIPGYREGFFCLSSHAEMTFDEGTRFCKDRLSWLVSLAGDDNVAEYDNILKRKTDHIGISNDIWVNAVKTQNGFESRYSIKTDSPRIFRGNPIPDFDNTNYCPSIEVAKGLDKDYSIKPANCSVKNQVVCERMSAFNHEVLQNTPLCQEGWFYSVFDHKCRKLFLESMSFREANETCFSHNSEIEFLEGSVTPLMKDVSNITLITLNSRGCGLNNRCLNRGKCIFEKDKFVRCECNKVVIGEFCEKSVNFLKTKNDCPIGRYSKPNCDKFCNCKDNAPCDSETGECPMFKCLDKYFGSTCSSFYEMPRLWWKVNSKTCCTIRLVKSSLDKNCGSCDSPHQFMCQKDPENISQYILNFHLNQ